VKQVGFESGVKREGVMYEQSGETEEEELNRTNTQNKQTNKKTVNDMSKPCLSACVDNKGKVSRS